MTLLHSGWGVHFLDYDNDGFKDLLIAQGHDLDTVELNYPQLHYKEPLLLALEHGQWRLRRCPRNPAMCLNKMVGRGMAVEIWIMTVRLDAVITTNGGPAYILHNETATQNHWLTLLLVGHKTTVMLLAQKLALSQSMARSIDSINRWQLPLVE